jgi:hypothetical protein
MAIYDAVSSYIGTSLKSVLIVNTIQMVMLCYMHTARKLTLEMGTNIFQRTEVFGPNYWSLLVREIRRATVPVFVNQRE